MGFNDWLFEKYRIGGDDLTDEDWELLYQEYLKEVEL